MRDLRPQSRLGHHAETPTAVFKQSVFWNPFMWVFWNPKSKSKPILTWSWSVALDQKILWWRTKKKTQKPEPSEKKEKRKNRKNWRPNLVKEEEEEEKKRNLETRTQWKKKEKKKEEQWRLNLGEERKRKRRRQCQELSWQYNVIGHIMCV